MLIENELENVQLTSPTLKVSLQLRAYADETHAVLYHKNIFSRTLPPPLFSYFTTLKGRAPSVDKCC